MNENDGGGLPKREIVVFSSKQLLLYRMISGICDRFMFDNDMSLLEISGILHHVAVTADVSIAARAIVASVGQPPVADKTNKPPGIENN